MARVVADLRDHAAGPHGEQAGPAAVLERALESIACRRPGPENPDSRATRVWRLVVGAARGTWFWGSAILLLVYNVLRALPTMLVAPMRDEEERSGVAPAYRPSSGVEVTPVARLLARLSMRLAKLWWTGYARWTEAYGWLIWPHRVVTVLFWLAVASFAWNAWHWLMLDVWLPAATNTGP